ncbi:MAG: ABC transporter permease [Bacteriovoracaceae bacterium]|nr:ABC transporter permease [Bacteriovoracaceae bacterium]
MRGGVFSSFSKTLIWDRANFKFAIGVWLGLSFSIAVILSTIGIMDGFVSSMKKGLRQSNGDLYFYSRSGFFTLDTDTLKAIEGLDFKTITQSIESQAFLVVEGASKGVAVKGIEGDSFSKLTGKDLNPEAGKIIIGDELAEVMRLKIGDNVVLVLAKGNKSMEGLPLLKNFTVQGIVDHGIYQKDLRFAYLKKSELSQMLGVGDKVNMVAVNVADNLKEGASEKFESIINEKRFILEDILGIDFRVKPFWYDFSSLLEAVEIEKFTIGLILQIIVIISIFNVLSFVTFLNEKKAREVFLFQALGLSSKALRRSWLYLVFILWVASCAFSLFFVVFFNYLLENLPLLSLPGDVYHLGRLSLSLELNDFILVFASALLWLLIIVAFSLYRMNKRSILYGLRKEFS